MLGTIGGYFHDLTRRGDLVFGVMTGLKVYRLDATRGASERRRRLLSGRRTLVEITDLMRTSGEYP